MKLVAVSYTRIIIKYYRNTDYQRPESRMTMKFSEKLDTLTGIKLLLLIKFQNKERYKMYNVYNYISILFRGPWVNPNPYTFIGD